MRLFCYGTLQFPEVMERACGCRFSGVPAVLDNHVCYTVRGRVFPGIRLAPGRQTPGTLYTGLGRLQLGRLDDFESDFYQRVRVMVTDAQERPCEAWVYVVRPAEHGRLTDELWDRAWFERLHLRNYLRDIGRGQPWDAS